jgi:Leucine-rich repeat (LRR) protein
MGYGRACESAYGTKTTRSSQKSSFKMNQNLLTLEDAVSILNFKLSIHFKLKFQISKLKMNDFPLAAVIDLIIQDVITM